MRLAAMNGRAVVLREGRCADIATISEARCPADPMGVLAAWTEVASIIDSLQVNADWTVADESQFELPVPTPAQSIGIGLNYRDHAAEAQSAVPDIPLVFSKLPSCLNDPHGDIEIISETVDYEVELVVVLGKLARNVAASDAYGYVAGFGVGQDISERTVQRSRPGPQLTLAKSMRTFGPVGPTVVGLEELVNPGALRIQCSVNGEVLQDSNTRHLIFDVPALIEFLSARITLLPGDLIFTGTPAGVGGVRNPPRYLQVGDVIESEIEGVGRITNRCVSPSKA